MKKNKDELWGHLKIELSAYIGSKHIDKQKKDLIKAVLEMMENMEKDFILSIGRKGGQSEKMP